MRISPTKTDVVLSVLWFLLYLAFCEVFGDSSFLFYLIHTPPLLFIIPSLLYISFRLFQRNIAIIPILTFLLIYSHLNLLSGRSLILRNSIPESPTTARICSWNTAYFFQWGREVGFQRIVDQNCDFILLQEVWNSESKTEEISKVRDEYFPKHNFYTSGEFLVFAPNNITVTATRSVNNGYFSVSLPFHNKLLSLTSVHLWNPITDMPSLSGGKLHTVPAVTARNTQKAELLEFLTERELTHDVSVVLGDFNTTQNGKIIRQIPTKGYSFISTPLYVSKNTYSTRLPLIQIDFAYVSSEYKDSVVLKTICKPTASDHCLLIVDLML